jgi:aspartate kinase
MYIVYKLGGTSQCKVGYDRLIKEIKNNNDKNKIFVVLSAVSGVTNNLVKFTETKNHMYIDNVIDLNYKLIKELDLKEEDFEEIKSKLINICQNYIKSFDISDIYEKSEIIGYGEVFSTNIFYKYIDSNLYSKFDNIILHDSYKYIKSKKEIFQCNSTTEFYADFSDFRDDTYFGVINIFQGFIVSTPSGKKVLLGRGGSDTTGALIANSINAKYYEVWTDVDGIYTTDPRIFEAELVENIDYDLIQEIASMGAKVMHPLSIKPCADKNIPIYVKNTFNETSNGTKITKLCECNYRMNRMNRMNTFYAIQKNETIFKIKSLDMWNSFGFLNDIFRQFSENKIDVNIVTTSQFSVSATTNEQNKYKLLELQQKLSEKYEVILITDCIIFSIVTRDIKNVMNKINFNNINAEIIHISDNNMTINFVIRKLEKHILENIKYDINKFGELIDC